LALYYFNTETAARISTFITSSKLILQLNTRIGMLDELLLIWNSSRMAKEMRRKAYVENFCKSDAIIRAEGGIGGLYVKVGLKPVNKNADRVSCSQEEENKWVKSVHMREMVCLN
jgi:hypothetical protein